MVVLKYILGVVIFAAIIAVWAWAASKWSGFRGGCGACSMLGGKCSQADECKAVLEGDNTPAASREGEQETSEQKRT